MKGFGHYFIVGVIIGIILAIAILSAVLLVRVQ